MKLQNHFTTIEQSKRLLELGVPKSTADLYAIARFQKGKYSRPQVLNEQFTRVEARINRMHPNYDIIPIWSFGRLLEICAICVDKYDIQQSNVFCYYYQYGYEFVQCIIDRFGKLVQYGDYFVDFSRLKD